MGGLFSSFHGVRGILFGLDSVGKTTILYRLKLNRFVNTIPTIGFSVEEINHKGFHLSVWDIGGNTRNRVLWNHYCHNCHAIIYVIDSADTERLNEVKNHLFDILQRELLRDSIILIYANKQDLPNALKPKELAEQLKLNTIPDRDLHIQGACSLTGEGLTEGLDWLLKRIQHKFF